MKIILCPDSFKGTLTATEAVACMECGVRAVLPHAEILKLPIADGGEGSIEALGAIKEPVLVSDPYGNPISAYIGRMGNETYVVEMATAAGLPLVGEKKDPSLASTYGVGEEIRHALDCGAKEIILCLGGSATNDAGCGMAAALGVGFYRANGERFVPVGKTLSQIDSIDLSTLDVRLKETKIVAMCDVTNPLYGKNGAAYVYAPQKGANAAMVEALDAGLRHFAAVCRTCLSVDVSALSGGGAAGGMGAGVVALLGGSLQSGIETVLRLRNFDHELENTDLVLTGEGRFDGQSVSGKLIFGIASHMEHHPAALVVIAGSVAPEGSLDRVTAAFSIQTEPLPFSEAILHTQRNLERVTENAVRLWSHANKQSL